MITDALEAYLISEGAASPVTARTDTDGDGIPDYLEVTYGSQPFDGDSPFAAGTGDEDSEGGPAGDSIPAVSYTHLTLPTICSV